GPAVSYAIGQGATMVSASWGVFVWREFANAPVTSRRLIPLMFLFFVAGLAAVAVAPILGHSESRAFLCGRTQIRVERAQLESIKVQASHRGVNSETHRC